MMDGKSSKAFAQRVDGYMAQGYRVESQTESAATLVRGERVNHVLHLILSMVTLGAWVLVWVLLMRFGGRTYVTVQVGPAGGIHETRRRDLSGCALHALTAWIVLQLVGAVALVVLIFVAAAADTQSGFSQPARTVPVRQPTQAPTAAATPTPVSLADEFGCQWIMDTARPMFQVGRDLAIQHLATSMMLKRQESGGGFGFIGSGDAAVALRACESLGDS